MESLKNFHSATNVLHVPVCVFQRLTQTNPSQRDHSMTAYRDSDLLGCTVPGDHRVSTHALNTIGLLDF